VIDDSHVLGAGPSAIVSRRAALRVGAVLAGSLVVGSCASSPTDPAVGPTSPATIGPTDPRVAATEAARRATGNRVTAALNAAPTTVDLGGMTVSSWAFNGSVPGPLLRARLGDTLAVTVSNQLPEDTTIHWHGLALRNDMDGVPDLTQPPIRPGASFTYEFVAPHPGTYWFHPHVGTQLDRGLYAPLIIDDPADPGDYDLEETIVLDDWLDGTGRTPSQVLAELQAGRMDMSARPTGSAGYPPSVLGGDPGDVTYPVFLLNGRTPTDPVTIQARPGQRARLRIINAASDTVFRVALADHPMTVQATDGFAVRPVPAAALLVGMGERYDVTVTLRDGVFPLVAVAEGKNAHCRALIRTGTGPDPAIEALPAELTGPVTTELDLTADDPVLLADRTPDRVHDLTLGGGMMPYRWTINGRTFDQHEPLVLRPDEFVRLRFGNTTTMYHPMHVHGHTFQVRHAGAPGARKDTVMVMPGQTVTADLVADNPGQWLTHCHNLYHGEAGMMTVLSYQL
jgi:FtsP/CotA-like multicopper oxidase with cupredoxin domain